MIDYWEEIQHLIQTFQIDIGSIRLGSYAGKSYSRQYYSSDKDNVILLIKDALYQLVHCRSSPHPKVTLSTEYNTTEDFIDALSRANNGKGTWDSGWEIRKIERGGKELAVYKDGLTIFVRPGQFSVQDNFIEAGKTVKVMMTKEYRALSPGFYMAIGDAESDSEGKNSQLIRIYWNIMPSGASQLMKYVTMELNGLQVPFRFKILNNPRHFPRADAAVLYIKKYYLRKSREGLQKIYKKTKASLNPSIPLFAKRLCPGISLAEDPNNNQSFGENRCYVFAQALYNCHKHGTVLAAEGIECVRRYFKSLALDLDQPYLNASSEDEYDLLLKGAFEDDKSKF
jgi:type III HopA1-like effector protein